VKWEPPIFSPTLTRALAFFKPHSTQTCSLLHGTTTKTSRRAFMPFRCFSAQTHEIHAQSHTHTKNTTSHATPEHTSPPHQQKLLQ